MLAPNLFSALTIFSIAPSCIAVLNAAQRNAVLGQHNLLRSQLANGQVKDQSVLLPKGKNIYRLAYNATIEKVTQATADTCTMEHSSSGYGENLFLVGWEIANLSQALVDATNAWWSEKDACPIAANNLRVTTAVWDACGHMTPIAWSHTTQLACAVKVCGAQPYCQDWSPPCTKSTFVVCNYYNPTDDSGNTLIYEKGSPCQASADCTWYKGSACDTKLGLCVAPLNPKVASNSG